VVCVTASASICPLSLHDALPISYAAGIAAGAATVMTAFNDLDGVPATGSKWLMTDILRGELKFEGFVVTDYTAINEMTNHRVVRSEEHTSELQSRENLVCRHLLE